MRTPEPSEFAGSRSRPIVPPGTPSGPLAGSPERCLHHEHDLPNLSSEHSLPRGVVGVRSRRPTGPSLAAEGPRREATEWLGRRGAR
jgi:hypothetical protein